MQRLCQGALLLCLALGAAAQPFTIEDAVMGTDPRTQLRCKVLKNHKTGESVSVIHEAGGRVESLRLFDHKLGALRDVLVTNAGDPVAVRLNAKWKGCMLAPFANRVRNGTYTFLGRQYFMVRNEVNADRADALHGFLCNKSLSVAGSSTTSDYAALTLTYQFSTTENAGYPFQLAVTTRYVLMRESRFEVHVTAQNNNADGTSLPFTHGWHPYFVVKDMSRAVVTFDKCQKWNHVLMGAGAPLHGDLIPTGRTEPVEGFDGSTPIGGTPSNPTYYDDEFKATEPVSRCPHVETGIYDPVAGGSEYVLWQDSSYRITQIYTGSMTWTPNPTSAIAFEPMSGLADAFNNADHLAVISAGETWEGRFGVFLR